jgi:hypothetical protein
MFRNLIGLNEGNAERLRNKSKSIVPSIIMKENAPRNGCPHLWLALFLIGLALQTTALGCRNDGGLERVIVSGKVIYNGQPVSDGDIRFVPIETSHAPASGATIVNGQYKVDGHGGAAVGKYKVVIQAYRMDKSVRSRFAEGAKVQYLPPKYNTNTQLELTIESGSSEIAKDFELPN